MENASIALAEEAKRRITKHLRTGYVLRKNGLGLEHYTDIVRYNAVADSILGEFGSMVSLEDYSGDEDVSKRIVSMEGLLSSIKNFLFKKKKEVKETQAEPSFYKRLSWVDEEVQKLLETYEEKEGTVTIPKRYADFLVSPNMPALIKADCAQYKALFTRAKPTLDKSKQFRLHVEKEFDKFVGDTDRLEQFQALLKDLDAKQTKGLFEVFKEPGYNFVGFGKEPFKDQFKFFYTAPQVYAKTELELAYPSKKYLTTFINELRQLILVFAMVEEYEDQYPIGLDVTDPPIRGYLDDDIVTDYVNDALYLHEIFDDYNSHFTVQLRERIGDLVEACIVYLEHVFK